MRTAMSIFLTRFAGLLLCAIAATALAAEGGPSIVASLATTSPGVNASTVPANGDLNPYGVAFVPAGFPGGVIQPGDVLVSNFNGSGNLQGTGRTIVRVTPTSGVSLFFQFQGPTSVDIGLTTALGVLREGFVIVGNLPSTGGLGSCSQTAPGAPEVGVEPGSLLVIDRTGKQIDALTGPKLQGPWDLTVHDQGRRAQVFVSNALSGAVTRLDLRVDSEANRVVVEHETQIASGYAHHCDPAAMVVGPTGLALDAESDVLYVASTGDNAIYAVHRALERRSDGGPGRTVVIDPKHLHGPLGLALTPDGDLLTTQGDAPTVNPDPTQVSELVEYDADGHFIGQFQINPNVGSAFGLALAANESGIRFATVDDFQNTLEIWTLPAREGEAKAARMRAQTAGNSATMLTANAASNSYGQTVTLTATVSGATPTGNVIFYDGTTALGTVALAGGRATLSGISLGAGSHALTAGYGGDANNAASTSAVVSYGSTGMGGGLGGRGYGGALGVTELALLAVGVAFAMFGRRRGSRVRV